MADLKKIVEETIKKNPVNLKEKIGKELRIRSNTAIDKKVEDKKQGLIK